MFMFILLFEYFQHRERKSVTSKRNYGVSIRRRVYFPKRERQLRIPRATPSSANHLRRLRPLRAYAVRAAEAEAQVVVVVD
jgi:hypothetical protein